MQAFHLKRGDTAPSLLYELPAGVDLTAATVRFSMRAIGGAVIIDSVLAVVVTPTGSPVVRYDWTAPDSADAAYCDAEFEVTYAGGAVETFPNVGFIRVIIEADV